MNITKNRWFIAIMATLVHLGLGTVYAWSFFQSKITDSFGWNNTQTALAFSISIFMLGITASWGGQKIDKFGPKKLAITGVILYALGYIISYFSLKYQLLFLLYLGFGIIGGIGLGLAYVTPVATVSKWFPDKQGVVTGMVVMGFGLGALLMSKFMAPLFMSLFKSSLSFTFLAIGVSFLILLPLFARFLSLPNETNDTKLYVKEDIKILTVLTSRCFILIWIVFMFNVVAGMIFISFQSQLLQDLLYYKNNTLSVELLAASGATLIGISALFNGVGRFFWGSVSDKVGRINTFRLLLAIELLIFILLIFIKSPIIFSIGVCIILLNYGGGFGVLPSLIKDYFGTALMPAVYGAALTAWSVGGIIGPQIIAFMTDRYSTSEAGIVTYKIAIAFILVGLILSLLIRKKL